ncbi:MAG TPA: hypothetical protein VEU52_11135 [Candidatus Limnocylindrales bacterium]|nr:hypothetical protein [Candidatus Limnocylindrales bacterium]
MAAPEAPASEAALALAVDLVVVRAQAVGLMLVQAQAADLAEGQA